MNKMIKFAAIAVMVLGLSSTFTSSAEAARSYVEYAKNISNPVVQQNFIKSMIRNYSRVVPIYENIVNRYATRYSKYAWFARIQSRLDWYKNELAAMQSLQVSEKKVEVVTLLKTDVKKETKTTVERDDPTVISEVNSVVEEREGDNVNVYAVLTKVFETKIHTKQIEYTYTTKHYSNGKVEDTVSHKVIATDTTSEQETKVDREFIRQYAYIPPSDGEGPALNVLTPEQYLARADVTLYGAGSNSTYHDAVKNLNSRINSYYATEVLAKNYGNIIEEVNAHVAWSRGWTGKGSTIAIMDSGIDLDHSEFAGRIKDTECFTRTCDLNIETVDDTNWASHGTHVAGIAAAALDGKGTTGIAPDADLLIGKVAYSNGYFEMPKLDEAITWAVENGADAINVSANMNYGWSYTQNVHEMNEDGVYVLKHDYYESIGWGKNGYANLLASQQYSGDFINSMQGHEAVVVMSAGNQGLDYVTNPAHLAVATDKDGNLLLDGRALIVGNWDMRFNKIARSSNKAGTVCYDYSNDKTTCNSDYRVKDFYIMAPGQYVAAPDKNGEYRVNSGTSMAAPVVTGAVAVLHQMWPHMKGDNLVKLILQTGNKDIPNYDENVHGQGLLDLDYATQPQGVIGIPTTGRVDGVVKTVNQVGNTGLNGGIKFSALSSMMVIDEFDRDYYVDGNQMIQTIDTRSVHTTKAAMFNVDANAYTSYAMGLPLVQGNGTTITMNQDGTGFSLEQDITNKVSVGFVQEEETFLGNYANSMLMNVNDSTTGFVKLAHTEVLGNGFSLFGDASLGVTHLNVDGSAMMKDASMLISNSANVGAKYTKGNNTFGFVAGLPIAITKGDAKFEVADSVSLSGDIQTTEMDNSLATESREYNVGMFYTMQNQESNTSLTMFSELRNNYTGVDGETNLETGIKFAVKF